MSPVGIGDCRRPRFAEVVDGGDEAAVSVTSFTVRMADLGIKWEETGKLQLSR